MSVVEEIKQKLDIVEVISQYGVPLKKAGRTFKACCPFHPEKTPSFIVNPDRQSWHCFGACSTGGDAFAFVMRWEKVEFGQALRLLAERAGVSIPDRLQEQNRDEPAGRLYEVNEAASLYYHHLLRSSNAGETARRYLEGRAISPKTTEEWQLGYSPPGWDDLFQYLNKKGYNVDDMAAAGVLVEKEGKGGYDRFRHRLVFPIFNRQGRVIGFGARALDDSHPKYLNSPQTALFDKSRALYGIHRAHGAIRKLDQAVIVEGYMDVLMAHQSGYDNVVASLGTALTQGQVEQFRGLTKNLILALDADAAGQEATLRGLAVAQETMERRVVYAPARSGRTAVVRREEEYAEIKIAVPAVGKDPDEVLREDPALWDKALAEARPVVDYLLGVVSSRTDRSGPRGKRAMVESILPFIAEIKSPVSRESYIGRLAGITGVSEKDLGNELAALMRPAVKDTRPVKSQPQASGPSGDCEEDYCLSLLLRHPDLRPHGLDLNAEFFSDSENRQIYQTWIDRQDADQVCESVGEHLKPRLDSLMIPGHPDPEPGRLVAFFEDCRAQLEQKRLKEQIRQLGILQQEAEMGGEQGPDRELASQLEAEELALNARLMASYRARTSLRAGRKSGLPQQPGGSGG